MGSARKYLALALAACQTKQYEEAGVFLAQAASEEDANDLAKELGANDTPDIAKSESLGSDTDSDPQDPVEVDTWDDETGIDEQSISYVPRRAITTTSHIGKIMAAAMALSSDEDDEADVLEDDEDEDSEPDPDFPGESLIPASFSSVKVKSVAVKSPVRMKG